MLPIKTTVKNSLTISNLTERKRKMEHLEEVISTLKKGHNSALHLDAMMHGEKAHLVQDILCSLSKAINSLEKAPSAKDKKRKVNNNTTEQSGDKRRNIDAKSNIKVVRESPEDTYVWRKYGQKEIQGLKYPRCYYRCTNKYDLNCQATKQVQQSEVDPSKYEILYIGKHTCTEFYNPQETENSSFVIDFSSNNRSAKDSQNNPFPYSSSTINSKESETIRRDEVPSNGTLLQNTETLPDSMCQIPLMHDHMPSPSIQSSSGSVETTFEIHEQLFRLDDPCDIDPFDQFLANVDNSNVWNDL